MVVKVLKLVRPGYIANSGIACNTRCYQRKRKTVRLVEVSGRPIPEIAADLGVGRATLIRWIKEFRDQDFLSGPHEDTSKELARLRKENELLRQERDLLQRVSCNQVQVSELVIL